MKKVTLAVLLGLCVIVYGLLLINIRLYSTRASGNPGMNFDAASDESLVQFYEGAANINLYSAQEALFTTSNAGAVGVTQFLADAPSAGDTTIIPEGFAEQAVATRQLYSGNQVHYFYQQTISGVPVYGATLSVHQQNGNQIYALNGNLATESEVFSGSISEEKAILIALEEGKKEASSDAVKVGQVEQVIFNGQALGVSDDSQNYLSFAVTILSNDENMAFGQKYLVSSVDGSILFTEGVIRQALDRQIKDCKNSASCSKSRNEGEPAVNIADVDKTYDVLGTSYEFLNTMLSRDGFDGKGSAYVANVQYRDQTCPNAWFDGRQISICKGLAVPDIIVHEFTHAMNKSGPAFLYANQSGAIDEALADIYAYAVDNNWTSGEESSLGIIRSLEDPAKYGQPDRLFSTNYYCGTQDQGGVHKNGGILAKAFYLMVQGGSFNGCTVSAVGKEKAYKTMYKATHTYMNASTNFKSAYTAINQACGELNGGADSVDCNNIKNAMLAVEMDQQPDGSQKGPTCDKKTGQKPVCTTGGTTPSDGPSPTAGGTSPTKPPTTPTQAPGTKGAITLNMRIRLQGLFNKPPGDAKVPVMVKLSGKGGSPPQQTVQFDFQSDGTLNGSVKFDNMTSGSGYTLYVKGPKHLQRKICNNEPIEIKEGGYRCEESNLNLKTGDNALNLAGILQLAGDIPDENGKQDGIINSFDISYVQNNSGKSDPGTVKRADLNYDGIIDGKDYSLIVTDNALWSDQN